MNQFIVILFPILIMIGLLILGGVLSETIIAIVRRRFPHFSYEGDNFLLWGGMVLSAFTLGMLLMYLLLR